MSLLFKAFVKHLMGAWHSTFTCPLLSVDYSDLIGILFFFFSLDEKTKVQSG